MVFSRKKWPKGEKIDMGAASGAILLIFRPVNKPEIRILFPGATDTNQETNSVQRTLDL